MSLKTGKPHLGLGYGSATISLTLAAVRGFYDFHGRWSHGPVVNPVPESPSRRVATDACLPAHTDACPASHVV